MLPSTKLLQWRGWAVMAAVLGAFAGIWSGYWLTGIVVWLSNRQVGSDEVTGKGVGLYIVLPLFCFSALLAFFGARWAWQGVRFAQRRVNHTAGKSAEPSLH